MAVELSLHQQMLDAIPHLRAFAISLTGNVTYADDLVQTALMKGLEHLDRFQPGTSTHAWLFTILRNQFYTEMRKYHCEVGDPDGEMAGRLAVMPEQGAHLDFSDMQAALAQLSLEQREALLLVAAEGVSYEEAARICGTNLGTIKSRVHPNSAEPQRSLHKSGCTYSQAEDVGRNTARKRLPASPPLTSTPAAGAASNVRCA